MIVIDSTQHETRRFNGGCDVRPIDRRSYRTRSERYGSSVLFEVPSPSPKTRSANRRESAPLSTYRTIDRNSAHTTATAAGGLLQHHCCSRGHNRSIRRLNSTAVIHFIGGLIDCCTA